MKLRNTLMASCALALIGTTAMADCAADLARLQTEDAGASHGEGISKDGSLAPLETPHATRGSDSAATSMTSSTTSTTRPVEGTAPSNRDAAGNTAATSDMVAANIAAASNSTASSSEGGSEGIAKDGSLAPLEGTEPEAETPRAMSDQDVQAQQEGGPTAAESATVSAATTDAADTSNSSAFAEGATTGSSGRSTLIAEAQAALDAGDEKTCRAAVEKMEAL